MVKKRLYLVDGANYIFRAYYAMPGLSNSKGLPTGALYGYTQMLLKLLKEEKPDYIIVCFDRPEPTFRDELYDKYKANRKEPPDDLQQQFPYMQPLTRALGFKNIDKAGFEADDLIGTLVKRFAGEDMEVVIVSGDKDLMQLIGPDVTMLDEMKERRGGPNEVVEKFGVGPEGVIEVMGLAGDSSDNVPGISGVGMKTAMKLIAEYGSIEEVIAHAGEIKGVLGRKVAEGVESARLSRRLVTIDTDVPIELEIGDCVPGEQGSEALREMLKEFEFSKLLTEMTPASVSSNISYEKYLLITEERALRDVVNNIKNKKILSLDLETTGLDTMKARIVGFCLAWAPGEAAYVPVGHSVLCNQLPMDVVREQLEPVLADESVRKIGQNLNYDLSILRRLGFKVNGVSFDTMLASYVLNPSGEHNLDAMAARHLDHRTIHYGDVVGKGKSQKNFSEIPPEAARDYACEDADVALQLFEIFEPEIKEKFSDLYYKMEMPLLDVLIDMQMAGMKVDPRKLSVLNEDFSGRLAELEKKIYKLAGEEFNINSPKQLGVILFEKLGLPGAKKTKTGFSTSQPILEELAQGHDLPRLILDYRSLSKLKSTYVESLTALINSETGRVHTSFNQARTATGRLSSSDPNLQNIPARTEEGRKIREAFIAEDGFVLLSADYSQIELRVLAHMSGEENLLNAFKENLDVHAITASGIFGVRAGDVTKEQRAVGKTVNFATIYGQTAYGLSKQLGIAPGEAAEYIDNYFKKYPRVASYREEILKKAAGEGFVETLFGRKRFLPDINSGNGQLQQIAERMAFNTIFQGTAADIIKLAMISIHEKLPEVSRESRMLLQVHDELVFEVPADDVEKVKKFVTDEMCSAAKLAVPLVVDVGVAKNWAEAH